MKYPLLFSLASPESPSSSVSTETLVTILHVNPVPEVLATWQVAASEYEKAHPAKKVRFEYLDHEEFKATLPMLLESQRKGYLMPSSVGFSPRRFRVARARLKTSLAAFTVGWFRRMPPKRRSNL
jgi:hypothetical protein